LPPVFRTIYYSREFDAQLAEITDNFERWDDAFVGVEGLLSRQPEMGQRTTTPGIFTVVTPPWPGIPEVVVYYCFDANEVAVIGLRPVDRDT